MVSCRHQGGVRRTGVPCMTIGSLNTDGRDERTKRSPEALVWFPSTGPHRSLCAFRLRGALAPREIARGLPGYQGFRCCCKRRCRTAWVLYLLTNRSLNHPMSLFRARSSPVIPSFSCSASCSCPLLLSQLARPKAGPTSLFIGSEWFHV